MISAPVGLCLLALFATGHLGHGQLGSVHLHMHLSREMGARDLRSLFTTTPALFSDEGLREIGESVAKAVDPMKALIRRGVPELQRHKTGAEKATPRSHKHVFDVMSELIAQYEDFSPEEIAEVQKLVHQWQQTGHPPPTEGIPQPLVQKILAASVSALSRYGSPPIGPTA